MAPGSRRHARLITVATLAIGLVSVMPATALGSMPERHQRPAWQHMCEQVAGGTLSDQEALVCAHSGEPPWSQARIGLLERFCIHGLGGQPVVRSQYPVEIVACFF